MVDSGSSGAPQYCAFAKQVCTDHSTAICGDAIQLMALDGLLQVRNPPPPPSPTFLCFSLCLCVWMLQKQMVEKHWRDVRVHQILEGTNEIMRHIIGRALVS
jgi:alkylation response protein AidB-like acyl-CoA dehydrogenase